MFDTTAVGYVEQLLALVVVAAIAIFGIAPFNRYIAGFFVAGMLLVAVDADMSR